MNFRSWQLNLVHSANQASGRTVPRPLKIPRPMDPENHSAASSKWHHIATDFKHDLAFRALTLEFCGFSFSLSSLVSFFFPRGVVERRW